MNERIIPVYLLGEPVVIIPFNLIMDKDSKGSDLLVYLAIASFLHGRQWGLPFQEEIMRRAKYHSTETVMKAIKHLHKIGWATPVRRGLTQPNITILHGRKNERISVKKLQEIKDVLEVRIWR